MKNSLDKKRTEVAASIPSKNAHNSTFDKGNLNVILNKVKQALCRHRHTRGVTMVVATDKKIVRCYDCGKLLELDSIQGGS